MVRRRMSDLTARLRVPLGRHAWHPAAYDGCRNCDDRREAAVRIDQLEAEVQRLREGIAKHRKWNTKSKPRGLSWNGTEADKILWTLLDDSKERLWSLIGDDDE